MLKQLAIKNIAIIEHLDLDFQQGLTVITGESGSGKSILLDSIALAFGAKASPRDLLRSGCERGQVELLFDIGQLPEDAGFRDILAEQEITLAPGETEILLSREFTAGGSRSRINGVPVAREVLARLRPWVIDLHGQHELTSLFQKDTQRTYLDAYGGPELLRLKRDVAQAYEAWLVLKKQWDTLHQNQQALLQQRDFLSFQLAELEEAQLTTDDEDEQARQELSILSHAEKLIKISTQGAALLSEGEPQVPAVLDLLAKLEKQLAEGAEYDPALEALLEQVQGAHTELKAISGELLRYPDRVETDPARMAELTDRLDQLEKLKRKYGPTLREVLTRQEQLQAELADLETAGQNLDALEQEIARKEARLAELCKQLHQARTQAAARLNTELLTQLQVLAMPGVTFDVQLQPIAYSREGTEEVEFLFSANPGEPLKPLAKVASGGELSRFLLALKVLTAQSDGLLTLVFDEIDTGISGPTAKAVAEKLAGLSARLQVLAITHQPMIAAMGQQHWHVEKQVSGKAGAETVAVRVEQLAGNDDRRLKVLSRLVSGMDTEDEAVEKFIRRLQQEARAFFTETSPVVGQPR